MAETPVSFPFPQLGPVAPVTGPTPAPAPLETSPGDTGDTGDTGGGDLSGGTAVSTSVSGGPGDVNVSVAVGTSLTDNIQNNVNIGKDALASVTDAVQAGIDQASQQASQDVQDLNTAIQQQTTQTVQSVTNAANSLFGGVIDFLKNAVSSLAGSVGDIVKAAISNIGPILSDVADTLKNVLGVIGPAINVIATDIQKIQDTIIGPITTTILATIQTVGTLTATIERDLHDGIQGLLSLPGDIANGLGSLDSTINRALQQLGIDTNPNVKTAWDSVFGPNIGTPLTGLGSKITQVTGNDTIKTTFSEHVTLPEPNIDQAAVQTFNAIWQELSTAVAGIVHGGLDSIDSLKAGLPIISSILALTAEAPAMITAVAGVTLAAFLPYFRFLADDLAGKTGLAKLAPNDALQAYLRGFIDSPTLMQELAVNGWDSQRIQVMHDLALQLIPAQTAIDMYFRNILTQDDLNANFAANGITPADGQALVLQAARLVDVDTAATAYKRGLINDDAINAVLQQNRFTDNEIGLFAQTLFRPEAVNEYLQRLRRGYLTDEFLSQDTEYNAAPDQLQNVAKVEGLNPDVALDRWQEQFVIPPLQQWVGLYFRGLRTKTELQQAARFWRYPLVLLDDYIAANRALIPFRTIPTMLSAGIIDEVYATQQLHAHGFDDTQVNALLKYAQVSKSKAAAVAASDLKSVSVAAAKTAWDDGVISADQYIEILKAHGSDDTAAQLIVKVETMERSIRERSQTAQDIVNEALAGFITNDDAAQQLKEQGYTTAEQAKYLKQLRRATVSKAKLPSVAELKAFWKAGIIDQTAFQNALASLGYAQVWIDAFTKLDAPLPPATPATA